MATESLQSTPAVPSADPYIGSSVSLISKSEIQDEGVLFDINPLDSTVGIKNVRTFGTEGKKKDLLEVLPSDRMYGHISFRQTDTKDLQVLPSVPVQSAPATSGDPATIQACDLETGVTFSYYPVSDLYTAPLDFEHHDKGVEGIRNEVYKAVPCCHLTLFFLFIAILPCWSHGTNTSYHIDCGGSSHYTDSYNVSWLPDQFFSAGATAVVAKPFRFHLQSERTLRFFPISSGKRNCYTVPVPSSCYYIRTFTVYDNYDGKSSSPSFDVSVEGHRVFSWHSPWVGNVSHTGAYLELFANVHDGWLDYCFYSVNGDSPVINSLEIIGIDQLSYGKNTLILYARVSAASGSWGPRFTSDLDPLSRSWQDEKEFRNGTYSKSAKVVSTRGKVSGTNTAPQFLPMELFQWAVRKRAGIQYDFSVDPNLEVMIFLHFSEIDGAKKVGQRIFDVMVNEIAVKRVDIFKEVGPFAAYTLAFGVKVKSRHLSVKLVPFWGPQLICGLEIYGVIPTDLTTLNQQVVAMKALKESLHVPDRMGWNGDPCAPNSWDPWEGVTCQLDKDRAAFVVIAIDLGRQGLQGNISDQISLLSELVNLNLSSNSLTGVLPAGLGEISLKQLDLSNNQFSGSIPMSLASSNVQLLLLNNNLLEGKVPKGLLNVGTLDLSDNKGLCGVPPLPDCAHSFVEISMFLSLMLFCGMMLWKLHICIRSIIRDHRGKGKSKAKSKRT